MTVALRQKHQPAIVHVVDHNEIVCRSVVVLLQENGIPVRTHHSGPSLLSSLPTTSASAGCVFAELRLPGMDGLELLLRLKQAGLQRPVALMTARADIPTAVRAMKLGAFDFLEKPLDEEAFVGLARAMLDQPPEAEPSLFRMRQMDAQTKEAVSHVSSLSPREREVLDLLTKGNSSKMIARELGLSSRTVEIHRARIMERLGQRNIAGVVRLAVLASLSDGIGTFLASTGSFMRDGKISD